MANAALNLLNNYDLNIKYLKGQSFDNVNNTARFYTRLQARIKIVSQLAIFVPCTAHYLNLIGTNEASYYPEQFFFFIYKVHVHFFLYLLIDEKYQMICKKSLRNKMVSKRRFMQAPNRNWSKIIMALVVINLDNSEIPNTHCEASGILKNIKSLESSFLS